MGQKGGHEWPKWVESLVLSGLYRRPLPLSENWDVEASENVASWGTASTGLSSVSSSPCMVGDAGAGLCWETD